MLSNWKERFERYGIPILITLAAEAGREIYETWKEEKYRREDLRQAYRDVLEEREEEEEERRIKEFKKSHPKK